MMRNLLPRQISALHPDPRFGRLVLVSAGLHLAVVLLFAGVLLPRFHRDLRPVYQVDLVNLPVKNPQAGRPDARPEVAKEKPKPAPPAPPAPAAPPKPEPKSEPVKLARPEPAKAKPAAPAKKPEPVRAKPAEKEPAYEETLSAIDKMRRQKEIEDLKRQLDQLASRDTRRPAAIPEAPVGMPEGTGTEAGIGWELWIQNFLKANWALSRYQVSRLDLQAKVRIVYDADGNLLDYRFLDRSGDATFDDSVKAAILKGKKLPKKPGERLEIDVAFNLKDLLE